MNSLCPQCNHDVHLHGEQGCNWESFWGDKKCNCPCDCEESYSPYCKECGSCGEVDCCSPNMCKLVCAYPHNVREYKSMVEDYDNLAESLDSAYQTIATVKRLLTENKLKEAQMILEKY